MQPPHTPHRWLKNISIPAVFVTKSTGEVLKNLLKDKKEVYVSLDWNDALPRKKTVEWEFWTNSNDMCGAVCDVQQEFIRVCCVVSVCGGVRVCG